MKKDRKEYFKKYRLGKEEKFKANVYKWRKENPQKEAIVQKRMKNKYTAMMHEIKINGCAICGYNKCDTALDFHHVNPENREFGCNLRTLGGYKSERFITELNKCILLCKNCHYELHTKERGK